MTPGGFLSTTSKPHTRFPTEYGGPAHEAAPDSNGNAHTHGGLPSPAYHRRSQGWTRASRSEAGRGTTKLPPFSGNFAADREPYRKSFRQSGTSSQRRDRRLDIMFGIGLLGGRSFLSRNLAPTEDCSTRPAHAGPGRLRAGRGGKWWCRARERSRIVRGRPAQLMPPRRFRPTRTSMNFRSRGDERKVTKGAVIRAPQGPILRHLVLRETPGVRELIGGISGRRRP